MCAIAHAGPGQIRSKLLGGRIEGVARLRHLTGDSLGLAQVSSPCLRSPADWAVAVTSVILRIAGVWMPMSVGVCIDGSFRSRTANSTDHWAGVLAGLRQQTDSLSRADVIGDLDRAGCPRQRDSRPRLPTASRRHSLAVGTRRARSARAARPSNSRASAAAAPMPSAGMTLKPDAAGRSRPCCPWISMSSMAYPGSCH